jgi:hypothetical protein
MKNSASLSLLQNLIASRQNSYRSDRLPRKSALLSGILLLLFGVTSSSAVAFCQSQSSSQQSLSSQQSQAQPEQKKEDSSADAAKKTQKDKPKAKKVYTEEDLSGMRGNGVSVVGDETKPEKSNNGASQQASDTRSLKDEEYWRGRASKLRQQMAGVDEAIKNLKEEIKKNGPTGFDASTGLRDNVIYIDDRNARLKQLEQKRADLDKQMDLLQEEGRKAGASASWFR